MSRLRTIEHVDPATQAVLFALLGAVLGGAAVLAWRVSEIQQQRAEEAEEPALPDGVAAVLSVLRSSALVVDPDDVVLKATAPAYSMGVVSGERLVDDALLDLVRQVRRDGQIRESELLHPRRVGVPARHLTVRVTPLGARLVLVLLEDRTRERQVEAIRRDFVANVSHELKTPVGAIRLLSEAVTDAADDPEAVQRFAGRMGMESMRLGRLVQQIIELSRLQDDDPLEEPGSVPVDRLLDRVIDENSTDACTKEINVVRDGEKELVRARQPRAGRARGQQPGLQRGQLLPRGLHRRGLDPRRAVHGRDRGDRSGHRHPGRRDRPDLRALLPGRPGPAPLDRRHRSRALDRQARGGVARRRRASLVRGGPGLDVHPDAAAQAGRAPQGRTRREEAGP